MRFVIDEDMPRSLGPALLGAGHETMDVRDCGLRGKDDQEIFRFAQSQQACLITEDLGFANILRFPLGIHHGIVVARFPASLSSRRVASEVLRAIGDLPADGIRGSLLIVEIGQWRLRNA